MKIRTKKISFDELEGIKRPKHKDPVRPNIFFRTLTRLLSIPDMISCRFTHTETDMEKAGDGPWFILMNHSSFVDFEIANKVLYPKPFCVVATI